jgi:hypothetical protein
MSREDLPPRDINDWFELTYANYLVLNRAVLQSMPKEWQHKFVALLDELHESTVSSNLESPGRYRVHVVDTRGRYARDPIPHYRHAPNLIDV